MPILFVLNDCNSATISYILIQEPDNYNFPNYYM